MSRFKGFIEHSSSFVFLICSREIASCEQNDLIIRASAAQIYWTIVSIDTKVWEGLIRRANPSRRANASYKKEKRNKGVAEKALELGKQAMQIRHNPALRQLAAAKWEARLPPRRRQQRVVGV